MHNLTRKVDATVRSFYIFNSTYGTKEGNEKEKVLFYHPKDIDINMKITDIGLSQAFTTFTDTFTDEPGGCEVIHTEKTLQLLYQAEPNFWFVLVLNVPKEIKSNLTEADVTEYHGYELNENFYRRLLIMSYERFRLEQGTLQMILDANPNNGKEIILEKLDEFFSKYIAALKLPADDIFAYMRTLQYLPLDKVHFLKVHNFIESLKCSYSPIKDCLTIYKENIVTCGRFKPSELFLLHRFILERIANKSTEEPIGEKSQFSCHKVFLNSDGRVEPYQLVIYSSNHTILCLFFPDNCMDITESYLKDLGNAISSQLQVLAREIDDFLNKQNIPPKQNCGSTISNVESEYGAKYLFVNDQSFKMIQNLTENERKTKLSQTAINLIADLFAMPEDTLGSTIPSQEEIMVKSTDDFWIVKRRGNWRQRFVIVFSTKPTLLDMTREAERIFEQDIKDGVFADK